MKKERIIFMFLLTILAGIASCTKEVSIESTIGAMDKRLKNMPSVKTPAYAALSDSLFTLIDSFVISNADNPKTPDYLLRLAEYKNSRKDILGGAKTYELFQNRYPKHRDAAGSLFKAGIIYETALNDLVHAKKLYQNILKEYPESQHVDIVTANLEFLNSGLTAEQWLEKKIAENAAKQKN